MPVEFIHENELRKQAAEFLQKYHPDGSIPVPIEEIVEFQFKLDIIPIPGLHDMAETDGFISSDLSSISVEEYVYNNRRNRYRFTLAHELAHAVLHGDIYQTMNFSSIAEWKRHVEELSERDYRMLEWQANAFAGLVLVPSDALRGKYDEAVARMEAEGMSAELLSESDAALQIIAAGIADDFEVSGKVVEIRMRRDRLAEHDRQA